MGPKLPSDRDMFDKLSLILIFVILLLVVVIFTFKSVDEKDSSWARELASGVIGALMMKINSDRKPALGIPEGGSGTSTTVATVAPPAPVTPVDTSGPIVGAPVPASPLGLSAPWAPKVPNPSNVVGKI